MKRHPYLFGLFILSSLCAYGAEILWQAPQNITGSLDDFNADGEPVLLWSGGNDSIRLEVDGVNLNFAPGVNLSRGVVTNMDPHNRGGDNDYERLLGTMSWASSTEAIDLPGLVPGHRYRLQVWMADTRSASTQGRKKTYDSGAGSAQVILDSGPPSQFVIGTFTADSDRQVLRFVGGSDGTHPQYNILSLHDLGSPVPEINHFTASAGPLSSPTGIRITSGEELVFSWSVTGADSVTLSPDVGVVEPSGTITLSPDVHTTYTLAATNEHGTSSQNVTAFVDTTPSPPRINEIVSSNNDGLEDADGDAEDWIELYNPNPHVIDAGQYALTDDPMLIQRWQIPSGTPIPANGYLLLFASGKNKSDPDLHTHFKLNQQGEYLALVDSSNDRLIQQWPENYPTVATFPEIKEDCSYGYNDTGQFRFFATPTPGADNPAGVLGFVGDTTFSHKRGFHEQPFSLSITSDTEGATIRYTEDGTEPGPDHGAIYSSPIPIDKTTVIRAIAYKDGYEATNIDTQTYLFATDIIASAVMDAAITQDPSYSPQMLDSLKALPVISLTIDDPDAVDNSSERKTSVEMIFPDGSKGFQVDAGVSHFGGYYTNFAKKNYRLYFRKAYGPGKLKFPLFDGFENGLGAVDSFDALDLRTGSHDMAMRGAYLSNRFTDDTMLEMGQISPHGRFVHIIRNGVYWGQYHLRERWSASMASEYFGGEKDDYEAINGNANVGGWSPGVAYDGDGSGWETIKQRAAAGTPWTSLQSRVDLANYLDFILMYDFGSSENEYRSFLEPVDDGLKMRIYLNDADGYLNPTGIAQNNDAGGPGNLLGYLRSENHPDFTVFLADRIYQHYFHQGALSPQKNIARLQRRVDETSLSFLCESARWGYRTPTSWLNYQNNLVNNQFPAQTASRLSDLRQKGWYPTVDAPEYNQNGGVVSPGFGVTISNPSGGVVYYTTDGSDPRLTGGSINPAASNTPGVSSGFTTLIDKGSTWKYLSNGIDQGTSWVTSAFNDMSWSSGLAQFGYGDGDEVTQLSYGSDSNNKYITSYFRKKFTVDDAADMQTLSLSLLRDDGAVVYLNGVEILRSNMPDGVIQYATLANAAIGGDAEKAYTQFSVPIDTLLEGENVIAVEIHQVKATSSDISFDLSLTATKEASAEADLILQHDTLLQARVLSGGIWSALHPASFIVSNTPLAPSPGSLVLSEIHYHPSPPTPDELAQSPTLDDGDFEFLEIMNISSSPLRLDGSTFTDGIDFVFPEDSILRPNERLVVVKNQDAFRIRYSGGSSIAGTFSGGLKNSGERLVLEDPEGVVLISMSYGDGTDRELPGDLLWPSSPDGEGYSLVMIYPQAGGDLNSPALWRPSTLPHGSPGGDDATVIAIAEDRDRDGSIALLEATLCADDQDACVRPRTHVTMLELENETNELKTYLGLSITRNPAIPATVQPLISSDCKDWQAGAILHERTMHNDGTETLLYRFPTPYFGNPQFMRVQVSH
ncbi:lamin tail domain-containing protein [Verrucomicrobiaceae bacterium N1E253]|uniref:Lamin tail domain-containing protein n=1 Tax=Oceaniferula marina TaxID=2748318 RepID=A0A851GAK1_9BACT|nr:lamin tail domain-containing protein [Oceaniferula marina]NWK54229.1 lamin tail domain-containing protein [Oceaniferula marina]